MTILHPLERACLVIGKEVRKRASIEQDYFLAPVLAPLIAFLPGGFSLSQIPD